MSRISKLKASKPAKSNKAGAGIGAGCMTMFGLPFAGFAIFMAFKLGSMLWVGYDSQSWETIPANVLNAKLDSVSGDGSTTYKVTAKYRYNYQGQVYESEKVGLVEDRDNFKSYHEEIYERLKKAKESQQTVDCYVNPDNPSQALIDRTIRPVMIIFMLPFVIAFGLVGFGLMIGSIYVLRSNNKKGKLKKAKPKEPWLWREDWKQGLVESGTKMGFYSLVGFAILWNSISMPVATLLFVDDADSPWWAKLLVLIFPTIGLAMIGYCIYLWMRIQKFGKSHFRMASIPGVIGGKLTGVVIVPNSLASAKSIQTKLVCVQTVGRGDDQTDEVRWQDDRTIKQTLSSDIPGKIGIPIVFGIPSNAPPTNEEEDFKWKLSVKAKTPGVDFAEEFEVPVFWTEDSQENYQIDDEPLSSYEEIIPLEQQLTEQGIVVEHLTAVDSIRYALPPAKNKMLAFVITLFTIVFAIASVALIMSKAWIMGVVFSLFSLLMVYASFETWLGCSDLTIVGDRWTSRAGWFGFRGRGKEFSTSQIKSIVSQESMSSGSGSEQKQWKTLKVMLTDGKEHTLVKNVLGGSTERQLLADLRRRAGMETTVTDEEIGLWDFVEKGDFDDLGKEGNV